MHHGYRSLGIRTIPLAGKQPLIRRWQHVTLNDSFPPSENIGAILGEVMTIVDVDDLDAIDEARALFGPTPLESRTPKGYHLWYRAVGEGMRRIRPIPEL